MPSNFQMHQSGRSYDWNAYTVFLHEIGHVLGIRHEHVLGKVKITNELVGKAVFVYPQTEVDAESVMNYNYLFRIKDGKLRGKLSDLDISGIRAVYGANNDTANKDEEN